MSVVTEPCGQNQQNLRNPSDQQGVETKGPQDDEHANISSLTPDSPDERFTHRHNTGMEAARFSVRTYIHHFLLTAASS